jgi:hypothetical protein
MMEDFTMDADAALTTEQKALALNLDPATYGGFAEIGGGQERPSLADYVIGTGAVFGGTTTEP